jgi:hypothetical protein
MYKPLKLKEKVKMNECLNCEKEVSGRAKYCNDACRMAYKRKGEQKGEQKPEQIEAKPEQIANPNTKPEQNLTLLGRNYDDISPDDEFRLGDPIWGRVFTKETLPYWMFDGDMERDILPRARGKVMSAQKKRVKFRELMLTYDIRFGARDREGNLLSA